MKRLWLLGLIAFIMSPPAYAQMDDTTPPTTRVPMCLQYPRSKTYVPCTGVVPVNPNTGNPGNWDDIGKGTPTKPSYTVPVTNGLPVNTTNPLPVICTNCPASTGTSNGSAVADNSRRAFWGETTTSLDAGASYTGQTRDNGGSLNGTASKWNSFACFGYTDQPATVIMQASNDNTAWFPVQIKTITSGGGSVYLSQPMFTKYWRCQMANGNIAQTKLVLNSSFGM